MLSVFKTIIRSSLRPISDRVWPRVEARVRFIVDARFRSLEEKFQRLEAQTIDLQARIPEMQARIPEMQARIPEMQARIPEMEARIGESQAKIGELQAQIALLEQNWQKHVPAFLRATSTVVSFERELTKLKDVVLANERTNSSAEGEKTIPRGRTLQAGTEP